MPVVTVRLRPNGLPIAITGSPTWAFEESPSGIGVRSLNFDGSTFSTAMSVERSTPLTSAGTESPFSLKLTVDAVRALDHVRVRDDVAVLVDHEAGAGRGALLRQPERASSESLDDALGRDERDAAAPPARRCRRTVRPSLPAVLPVGCVVVTWRTTVLVSPVSITFVAIRTAPITSTIRPPMTPERMLDSGRVVVM